jgi:uncharacterized protein YjbI with pentapeptide repeats
MERDEAIKLLTGGEEGVREWNRHHRSNEVIDLNGADLGGANLEYANLGSVNLSRANLSSANLSLAHLPKANLHQARISHAELVFADLVGADLHGANLSLAHLGHAVLNFADLVRADLHGANLDSASLYGANLRGADLRGATLSEADLSEATLSEADLSGANLSKAVCRGTAFIDVDLSEVQGLAEMEHLGPSSISIDTLLRSGRKIHEAFLRGCGVPEQWIAYIPSLLGSLEPIQFYSCFISHSTKDKAIADRLHGRMVQERLRAWYAPHDMRGARLHEQQIDQAIRVYDKLLLIISKASMGSDWVRWEMDKAIQLERTEAKTRLFPIRLVSLRAIQQWDCRDPKTGRDYAKEILKYHILDFTKWKEHDAFEKGFAQLIDALKADESIGTLGDRP